MHGSFILAGLLFVGTCGACLLMVFGAGMSDAPSEEADMPVGSTFVFGTFVAVVIVASHWIPNIGW